MTTVISVIRASFLYAPWIALFWLLAVTVFAVRNVRSWLGWWGSGLFMIGFTALLFGLAFDPFLGWGVNRLVISQAQSGFSPGTMEMAINVLHRIVAGFSKPFLAQAGVILGVGLIMLMFRLFTGPRSKGEIGTKLTEPRSQI
ncbi:MAG: hypothetical protein E4G99_06685 [Anaerolineales bacterium]|nr:MAG: hypothetical protein E4G99_06685 [Anaerolineales bacterium]